MTETQFALTCVFAPLCVLLLIDGYRIFILKKKKKGRYLYVFFFAIFYYFLLWDADYFKKTEEYQRERYGIPPIVKSMELRYRSRFKEDWINSDTAKIRYASKIIKLVDNL